MNDHVESEAFRSHPAPLDDHLIHQAPHPLGRAGHGEPTWFEHAWMIIVPPGRAHPLIEVVFIVHPNMGFLHGYFIALDETVQYNLRTCRELTADIAQTETGPLSLRIREPLKAWNIELEEITETRMAMNMACEAVQEAQVWPLIEYKDAGAPYHTQRHMNQIAQIREGNVQLGGRSWDMSGWYCVRDHCWGFRTARVPAVHTWLPAFFPSRRLLLWHTENTAGDSMYDYGQIFHDDGSTATILESTFDAEFEGTEATTLYWNFTDSRGQEHHLVGRKHAPFGLQHAAAWTGENPGDYSGPLKVETDSWDLHDRSTQATDRKGLIHYHTSFELDGEQGYGVLAHYLLNDSAAARRARGAGTK